LQTLPHRVRTGLTASAGGGSGCSGSRPPFSAVYKKTFFTAPPSPRTAPGQQTGWRARTEPSGEHLAAPCRERTSSRPRSTLFGRINRRATAIRGSIQPGCRRCAHKRRRSPVPRLTAALVDASAGRPRRCDLPEMAALSRPTRLGSAWPPIWPVPMSLRSWRQRCVEIT
jgi:hypothetical protein